MAGLQQNTGRIKFFNQDRKFGFIVPDDGSRDVFIHVSGLRNQNEDSKLVEGAKVSYVLAPANSRNAKPGENQAINVFFTDSTPGAPAAAPVRNGDSRYAR